jgi:hypothetical protein
MLDIIYFVFDKAVCDRGNFTINSINYSLIRGKTIDFDIDSLIVWEIREKSILRSNMT